MNPLLADLYGHQAWADAEHWRAITSHDAARDDTAIRRRLHHLHLVQHGFLWAVGDRSTPFAAPAPEALASVDDLRGFAQDYHVRAAALLDGVTDARLAETIRIPWFKDPPLDISVAEALTQCAMHSHYHRGQNATRLRELGAEPPMTDLIVWYWKGRPAAAW
jgi:uncharacterized damage-inducible protein DinB